MTETPTTLSNLEALRLGKTTWANFLKTTEGKEQRARDFSEADLSNSDLADRDLSGADFFSTNLARTNLKMSSLEEAEFGSANLNNASLYKCRLQKAVFLEAKMQGADLSFSDCESADFRGADLTDVNFEGANLRNARFTSANLTSASFRKAILDGIDCNYARMENVDLTLSQSGGYKTMSGKFTGVRGIESCYGNAVFVRDVKDQDYIDTLKLSIDSLPYGTKKTLELGLFRAWGLIDHGRSLMKVSLYAAVLATLYGLIYLADMTMNWGMMDYSNSAQTWFTPFYYSLVTYTTLGYGDVTANSLMGEILVISEVVIGYFTLGLLLSILANTIARRS